MRQKVAYKSLKPMENQQQQQQQILLKIGK